MSQVQAFSPSYQHELHCQRPSTLIQMLPKLQNFSQSLCLPFENVVFQGEPGSNGLPGLLGPIGPPGTAGPKGQKGEPSDGGFGFKGEKVSL